MSWINRLLGKTRGGRGKTTGTNALNTADELLIDLGGNVRMEFVLVPAGSFTMGSDKCSALPVHQVTITKPFYMGKYAVTQEQWKAVMGSNPSFYGGERNPVDSVSWDACQSFAEKLNAKFPGHKFCLPSEAQWEYACRAGSTGEYCCGDDEGHVGEHAWHNQNSGYKTHAVGEKKANAWGLYDMHGNVIEWCQDITHWDYEGAPTDGSAWNEGGAARVARGGSFSRYPSGIGSAYRYDRMPYDSNDDYGLRVVVKVNS
jgi:formylglycine-generating enzyme required for sulfatase activity